MLHFVTSYMKQNKSRKQTLESAQYGLEISFNTDTKIMQTLNHVPLVLVLIGFHCNYCENCMQSLECC